MARVDLHAVEARLPGQVHRLPEIIDNGGDIFLRERPVEGGRIEVEAAGSADGQAAAVAPVGHVAAVAQLDGSLGALRMDGVRDAPEARDDFFPHPQLPVEGKAALAHGGIGQGGHSHPAARDGGMIVIELLRRAVAVSHVLERGRADDAVAKGKRADGDRRKYLRINHLLINERNDAAGAGGGHLLRELPLVHLMDAGRAGPQVGEGPEGEDRPGEGPG